MSRAGISTILLLAAVCLAEASDLGESAVAILDKRCFECHSHAAGKNKGGLVLDAEKGLLSGGESGPGLVPGSPAESLFLQRILSVNPDDQMPPRGDRLTAAEVSTLRNWVLSGATWPASRVARNGSSKYIPGRIDETDRAWWAYQPVTRRDPPAASTLTNSANPIDCFIDSRLEKEGLKPAPEAARAVLIRRATFDVTGLPPSPEEVAAFVSDPDPSAYARLVDRLLDGPGFGERLGRLWLDLVRYADSDGYRADDYRPTAWRYRDYVIGSFNANKPYDRFLQEQIAGDELFPNDPSALTGTGFLNHWIYEYNQRDVRGQWTTILNDITDTVGDVLLASGMQCARCHDHKFDPILQRDYFALRAFFSNILPVEDRPAWTLEEQESHRSQLVEWEGKTRDIRLEIAALEKPYREEAEKKAVAMFPEDIQNIMRKPESERTPLETQLAGLARRQVLYEWERLDRRIKGENRARLAELRKQLEAFNPEKPGDLPLVRSVCEPGRNASPVLVPKKGVEVAPAFLSVLSPEIPAPPAPIDSVVEGVRSSGRRATFARWLTRADNPLTPRIAMNRMWQQYFRRGLAPYTSDFGRLGEAPSHPELLDWLASEFVRSGWDQKAMHRLVLNSATYRRASTHPSPAQGVLKDPQNTFLWRFQPQRLEAEEIRDAILVATGEMQPGARGGPGKLHSEPVRSVYTRCVRNNRDPILDVFDAPEWFSSSSFRHVTTTPVQSLLLLNSPFMLRRGEALARRIRKERPDAPMSEQVARAYSILYSRIPSQGESARALAFISDQSGRNSNASIPPQTTAAFAPEKIPNRDGQAAHLELNHRTPFLADKTERLSFESGFTIESVIVPRSVSEGGALRVIAAKGSAQNRESFWQLGITGMRSRRAPMVLALQAYGTLRDGSFGEAVHFSGLRIEMNKPYFVAAAVRFATRESPGEVTFSIKDLSNDDEPLLVDKVPSNLVAIPANPHPVSLGGRCSADPSGFHGALDDVRLSAGQLQTGDLLFTSEDPSPKTLGFWRFENKAGALHDSSGNEHGLSIRWPGPVQSTAKGTGEMSGAERAFAAFCHVLLNSTEFLYLE